MVVLKATEQACRLLGAHSAKGARSFSDEEIDAVSNNATPEEWPALRRGDLGVASHILSRVRPSARLR